MISERVKISDYIAAWLEYKGIHTVFELSGGMIAHLLDSLFQRKSIRVVSMHHEQGAAFAADAFGRMTGLPGVSLATSGPGAVNLLTGMGSCYFDSSPGLFITGQVNRLEQKCDRAIRQLERNDEMVEAKRRIFGWYRAGLNSVPHVTLNQEASWARSIYWMTSILVDEKSPVTRDELRDSLKKKNVDTRPVFPAISQYSIWPVKQAPQPVALRIGNQAINLPSGVCLRRDEVDYICHCIRDIITGKPQ